MASMILQPPTVLPASVNLSLTGTPGMSVTVQRASNVVGPWIDVGTVVIGPDGTGLFQDADPPSGGAFYRTIQPAG